MRFFQSKIMGLFWVGKIKIEYSYQIKVSLLGQLLVLKTSSRLVWLERHLKRFLTFESGLHFYFATVRYSLMWVAVSWTQSFYVHAHTLRFQMFQKNFFFSIFFRWWRQQAWEVLLTPVWIQLDATLHSE